jgi:hypothetical protein
MQRDDIRLDQEARGIEPKTAPRDRDPERQLACPKPADKPISVIFRVPLSRRASAEVILRGWEAEHPLTVCRLERLKAHLDLMIEAVGGEENSNAKG